MISKQFLSCGSVGMNYLGRHDARMASGLGPDCERRNYYFDFDSSSKRKDCDLFDSDISKEGKTFVQSIFLFDISMNLIPEDNNECENKYLLN